jgi:hypothetical protein
LEAQPTGRPIAVVIGTGLLAVGIGIGLLSVVLNAVGLGNMEAAPDARWSAFFVVTSSFESILVWLAFRGSRFARVACAFFAILSIFTRETAFEAARSYEFHWLVVMGLVTGLLAPVGAIFLFLPSSSAWYLRGTGPAAA